MIDNEILFTIFNYKNDENARKWKNILSSFFDTVVLDSGNDKINDDFIQFPNIYYSGLFNETKKLAIERQPKYVGIICSDVEIDSDDANKLIQKIQWLKTTKNVGVYQPSAKIGSKSWLGYNEPNKALEFKNLLEGWMQIIKIDVLNKVPFIDLNQNKYGWGIDNVTCMISNFLFKYLNVKDNTIQVFHPLGTGYDEKGASQQGIEYSKSMAKYFNISCAYMPNQYKNAYHDKNEKIIYN